MCSTILQFCLQNRSGLPKTPGIDIIPFGDNTTSMLKSYSSYESPGICVAFHFSKYWTLRLFIQTQTTCFNQRQKVFIHNPLTWFVKGWFLQTAQSIPCSNQYLPISLLWFCSAIHFPKSDSATAKLLELSQRIILTFPQLTMK